MDSRLELITTMVRPNSCVADIGTDHGHLIVELVRRQIAKSGYACDINKMPLEKARRAIKEAGLSDVITPVLCDGLSGLESYPIDHFVIAGMGGELIASILERSPFQGKTGIRYILQPMTKPEKLREYLYTNGFEMLEENCATEGRFTYSVMLVTYTGQSKTPSLMEKYLGGLVQLDNPHKLLYAKKVYNRLNTKINGLKKTGVDDLDLIALAHEINNKIKEWS